MLINITNNIKNPISNLIAGSAQISVAIIQTGVTKIRKYLKLTRFGNKLRSESLIRTSAFKIKAQDSSAGITKINGASKALKIPPSTPPNDVDK